MLLLFSGYAQYIQREREMQKGVAEWREGGGGD